MEHEQIKAKEVHVVQGYASYSASAGGFLGSDISRGAHFTPELIILDTDGNLWRMDLKDRYASLQSVIMPLKSDVNTIHIPEDPMTR